ncbi:MAG: LacI family DNA-binding transcriptional regulator [Kiritimatiellae bacterium]|jgi:LacI family transcriptional regulator|nr:LacI family DNA-binding transcriptional regulator [Kiritimatiellia bacterium]
MINQKLIAKKLGLSQSTVSRALRRDPQIPEATRIRVLEAADSMGYRPNPLVSSLMEQIRTGKKHEDHGSLVIVVDRKDQADWFEFPAYREHYEGFVQQARARGYSTDCIYLRAENMTAAAVDRICYHRGVDGIFFAAPNWHETGPFPLTWEHFVCGTVGYSWSQLQIDRVSTSHRHNADRCFEELNKRGYRRIGFLVDIQAEHWVDSAWLASSALHRISVPEEEAIPHFVINETRDQTKEFRAWMKRWQPTAFVCTGINEATWPDRMDLVPHTFPRVLCNRPAECEFAGMDENNRAVGATLCDLITARIVHNERGVPKHPQTVLIDGQWVETDLLPKRAEESVLRLQDKLLKK